MIKQVCNVCGKDFDEWDKQESFGLNYDIGYGSDFDGSKIRLDLCCRCFDDLMNHILPKCKISPIEYES